MDLMAINMLTPIETKYKGILFRSRLEARWALFFDKIRVPYQYEAEGYDLNGDWYLPDFWIPQQDYFIEIKGAEPTLEEQCKAALLAQLSGKRVFIFGPLPTIATYGQMGAVGGEWDSLALFPEGAGDSGYLWCLDLASGLYSIKKSPSFYRGYNSATDELVSAYNSARSARF
jgi:hypothetical protein